jgi:GTPase
VLADKPRVTALNKIDALDDDERAERKRRASRPSRGR